MWYTLGMMCIKCKIRYIEKNFAPLCYICGLKAKRFYRAAMKALKLDSGWWSFHTYWNFKEGWSIFESMCMVGIFIGLLKCGSLNKTPKIDAEITDFYSKYWVKRLLGEKRCGN